MKNTTITLYPANWLFNASVIGLLYSVSHIESLDVESEILSDSGEISFKTPFFSKLNVKDRYFGNDKIASIVGKSSLYRNYLQSSQKRFFTKFVNALDSTVEVEGCSICGHGRSLPQNIISTLRKKDPGKAKFLDRIKSLSIVHNSLLGPSVNEFPNAFWSLSHSSAVCHLCSYLLIHHHLPFHSVADRSEVFINGPSFKVMYRLNSLIKELYGKGPRDEAKSKREILAMSVIEYATKLKANLGFWMGMNLEVVSKKTVYIPEKGKAETKIEFFSLPYDVIQLISDREVAAQLSEIGEFKILNLVLKQEYSKLPELGYRLLRESLADRRNDKFINDWLYLWSNKGFNLRRTAERILRLYALIEQKQQRSIPYGNVNTTTA